MPSDALDRFLAQLRSKRSPRTVKTYGAVVASFQAFLATPDGRPSVDDIEAFLARRDRKPSVSMRNVELAALRAFGDFAVRHLRWRRNPAKEVPFERVPDTSPVVLDKGELRQLFLTAGDLAEPRRSRALAIVAVLSQVGLRVHEMVALDVWQVDLTTSTLLSVKGKGDTRHNLPLNVPARALLRTWLQRRESLVEPAERALIVSQRGRRLSIRSVERELQELRELMGTRKQVSPHSLRHTAGTQALMEGSDLATVAELLRHVRLETTRKYLHFVDTRRRDAVAKLSSGVPIEVLPAGNVLDAQGDLGVIERLKNAA